MTALTHRERALEAAESWEEHLDYPLEGVWRSEDTTNLADLVEVATMPTELLRVLRRYVTFHQGHVLPPELAGTQDDARAALSLYDDHPTPTPPREEE